MKKNIYIYIFIRDIHLNLHIISQLYSNKSHWKKKTQFLSGRRKREKENEEEDVPSKEMSHRLTKRFSMVMRKPRGNIIEDLTF